MSDPPPTISPWRSDLRPRAAAKRDLWTSTTAWWAAGIVLFAAAVVVPLFRQQNTRSWQALMAEDGSIYSQQAIMHGGFGVVLRGFAGYLQLPPRLLALAAPILPVRDLALYYAVAGTIVAALVGWFLYWVTEGWIDSRVMRLVLASFVVIMPALGGENTANVVNTIWVFAAVAPWALISLREGPRDTAIRAVVAFFAAASTPVCVIFVPVALGWAIIRRSRSAITTAAAFGAGLALQGVVVLRAGDTSDVRNANEVSQVVQGLGKRVYGVFLLGTKGVDAWFGPHNAVIYVGAPLVVLAIFGVLMWGAPRRSQAAAATFMALSVVAFVLPVWGRGSHVLDPAAPYYVLPLAFGTSARYSVIPIVAVASAIALLVAAPGRRRHESLARAAGAIFAAQVVVLAVIGFPARNYKSTQLQWRPAVDQTYAQACHGLPSDKVVTVLTSPNHTYSVHLTCRDLEP